MSESNAMPTAAQPQTPPLVEEPPAPEIYVDGCETLTVANGVAKIVFFSTIFMSDNRVYRRVVARMTMPLNVLGGVQQGMDDILKKAFAAGHGQLATPPVPTKPELPPIPEEMRAKAGLPAKDGVHLELARRLQNGQPVLVSIRVHEIDELGRAVTEITLDGRTVQSVTEGLDTFVDETERHRHRYESDNDTMRRLLEVELC